MNGLHPRPAARAALVIALLVSTLSETGRAQDAPGAADRAAVTSARAGAWSRDDAPAGWIVIETRNYQIQSRLRAEETEALGRHLEALLSLYRDLLPATSSTEPLVVKLLADVDEFATYVKAAGTSKSKAALGDGRFDPATGEVVVWNTRLVLGHSELPAAIRLVADKLHTVTFAENQAVLHLVDEATLAYATDVGAALARHCWQQYLYQRAWRKGAPELPDWFALGLAEHFATAAPAAKGRYQTGLNPARIRELGWLLLEGDVRTVGSLLRSDPSTPAYDAGPGPAAQGWSLIHFMLEHPDPAVSSSVPRLLVELGRSPTFADALTNVLAPGDIERLEAEWSAWAATLSTDDPLAELARDYGDKIRPEHLAGDADLKRRYEALWRRRKGPQPGDSR